MKDGEADQYASTDAEIFIEAQERFAIANVNESEDRISALEDLSFLNGDQWDTDIANSRKLNHQPSLTINHTKTNVTRVINTLKQQRPRIKCHPVGSGADVQDADMINGIVRNIESLSNASVAYDLGGASAIKIGWGYWRILGEYCDEQSFDQELKIKPISNAFTVYDDPSIKMPAGEDRNWIILSEKITRTEYRRKYPDAENIEWINDGAGDSSLNWESKEEIRLAEYYRIVEHKDELYLTQDGTGMYASEYRLHEKMAPGSVILARDPKGKPISRPTTRRQVEWYRLNGKQVVDRRQLPGRYIPVIKCIGNREDINGKIRHFGMVRDLKDPARMFNYWRTAETERYALAPKAPWVMAEGQSEGHDEWDDANRRAYSRLVYKPVYGMNGEMLPPPMRQPPVPVESGMAQAAAGAEHDLAAIAGMMPENPQDRASVVSGNKYLARRQGMADLVHWHYYDNQTYSIMMTGVMLLDLIPWYYDTERMQRIIGDDGMPSMVKINEITADGIKNNLTIGKYDVIMDTGPGYQTKREESTEAIIGLLGTPLAEPIVRVGADLIVRNMDFAGATDLADRLVPMSPEGMDKSIQELPKQAQAIVGALQQQLKQAQDTIQQQALEIKYKMQVEQLRDDGQTKRALITTTAQAHDTETKAQTADMNSQRDYDGWMEQIHIGANAKKDVAEIQAAASLLNTRAEAEADEKAAKQMIAAGSEDRE